MNNNLKKCNFYFYLLNDFFNFKINKNIFIIIII